MDLDFWFSEKVGRSPKKIEKDDELLFLTNQMVFLRLGQRGTLVDVPLEITDSKEYLPFSSPEGRTGIYKLVVFDDEIIIRSKDTNEDPNEEPTGYFIREHCWYEGKWSVYLADWTGEYYKVQDEESITNLREYFGK